MRLNKDTALKTKLGIVSSSSGNLQISGMTQWGWGGRGANDIKGRQLGMDHKTADTIQSYFILMAQSPNDQEKCFLRLIFYC